MLKQELIGAVYLECIDECEFRSINEDKMRSGDLFYHEGEMRFYFLDDKSNELFMWECRYNPRNLSRSQINEIMVSRIGEYWENDVVYNITDMWWSGKYQSKAILVAPKVWEYKLGSNAVWFGNDFGEVVANTYEDALEKAKTKLCAWVHKINQKLDGLDKIEVNVDSILVTLKK